MTLRTYEFYTIMEKGFDAQGNATYTIDSDIHYTFRDKARTKAGERAERNQSKVYIVRCQIVETIDDRVGME
jgi:hypothetical protein